MAAQVNAAPAVNPNEIEENRRADQAMGAAMIAAGVGSLALGLAIIGAEASAPIKAALTWSKGVGPLSGKVGVSMIAYVVSWLLLHNAMKGSNISLQRSFVVMLVLVILGVLLTFPPVFMAFG